MSQSSFSFVGKASTRREDDDVYSELQRLVLNSHRHNGTSSDQTGTIPWCNSSAHSYIVGQIPPIKALILQPDQLLRFPETHPWHLSLFEQMDSIQIQWFISHRMPPIRRKPRVLLQMPSAIPVTLLLSLSIYPSPRLSVRHPSLQAFYSRPLAEKVLLQRARKVANEYSPRRSGRHPAFRNDIRGDVMRLCGAVQSYTLLRCRLSQSSSLSVSLHLSLSLPLELPLSVSILLSSILSHPRLLSPLRRAGGGAGVLMGGIEEGGSSAASSPSHPLRSIWSNFGSSHSHLQQPPSQSSKVVMDNAATAIILSSSNRGSSITQ